MRRAVILLLLISVIVYCLQIIIFRDAQTTAFYIFQDLAFMPVSVALTTLVLGEILDAKEKKERAESTRMLTSSFYTQVGARLIHAMLSAVPDREKYRSYQTEMTPEKIRNSELHMDIRKENYDQVRAIVEESMVGLLILSSNSRILEQKEFTDMIWGIFHLHDEFLLRGEFETLSDEEIFHMNQDFKEVLRMLLCNSIPNAEYLRETYPNFYAAAREKVIEQAKR